MSAQKDMRQVWENGRIPVIGVPHRRGEIRVRVPFSSVNRTFLRVGQAIPSWNKGTRCWDIPRSHLDRVARRILGVFGRLYIIQTRSVTEVCAPACWNAAGLECECACNGEHHGSGNDDSWFVVSEAYACRNDGREYTVRLLTERTAVAPSETALVAASGVNWSTYFASAGNMLVKIGKSTDVHRRLRSLQTASPTRLELLAVVNGDFESEYHSAFAHLRVNGEWFQFNEHEMATLNELLFGSEDSN